MATSAFALGLHQLCMLPIAFVLDVAFAVCGGAIPRGTMEDRARPAASSPARGPALAKGCGP
jgi:hypothetical protein